MNSRSELTLAPDGLNSSMIHQRPQFADAVSRLRQTVRNMSQSQNIQLLYEHGSLIFAKALPVAQKDVLIQQQNYEKLECVFHLERWYKQQILC
ncbi:MAG: hypothetical protein EZS28_032816 [Streblomastix strix]|uniref:Uncharacterized protein n=1 Tax=Streblomastix strix TaxID=222440 RepID=A0A5J4UMB8_9EUKA|nr:MAG: hypothetical protein EZS28_032816 [Streblomastix strix]